MSEVSVPVKTEERGELCGSGAADPEMTDFERGLIVGYHEGGKSLAEIVEITGLPKRAVKKFLGDWKRGAVDAYTGIYKDASAAGKESADSGSDD